MTARLGGFGQRNVRFADAADAGVHDARRDFFRAQFFERGDDGFDRTLHVALDDQREFLAPGAS